MNPIALVTGASRGIGRATSRVLARRGFDLVIAARTMKEGEGRAQASSIHDSREVPLAGSLEATQEDIRALGREAHAVHLDLLDPTSVDKASQAALAYWGRVDLLVNNAIFQGPGRMDRILDLPLEQAEKILRANVLAQVQITQAILPRMVAKHGGTIINLTSGSGQMDPPGPVGRGGWGFAYAASKAAFHRLAGILHVEHRDDGIRAFNVDPGYTPTEAMRAMRGPTNDLDDHFRGAPPEVAAEVIGWLATDPGAAPFEGRLVMAQKLCRELQLLEGWPPARKPETEPDSRIL